MKIKDLLEVKSLPDQVKKECDDILLELYFTESEKEKYQFADCLPSVIKNSDLVHEFIAGNLAYTEVGFITMIRSLPYELEFLAKYKTADPLPVPVKEFGEFLIIDIFDKHLDHFVEGKMPPEDVLHRDLYIKYIEQEMNYCECLFIGMLRELVNTGP